jgi:plastocyanin/methionine-rich copper-binding protein CopC
MKIIILIVAGVVVITGIFLLVTQDKTPQPAQIGDKGIVFERPKKSAHYESNTPAHGAVLPGAPINVVLDFNFDLAPPSSISINKDGKDYGVGNTLIDGNKLVMRRVMDQSAPDGLYRVDYKACWPDQSCHTGYFQFLIDRGSGKIGYLDMSAKSEVLISLAEIQFKPQNIIVKKGARVIWRNDDVVAHYVNTDSHPAHTYYPKQNSRELQTGDTFAQVFDQPGVYPYHCSAHADIMTGLILVID